MQDWWSGTWDIDTPSEKRNTVQLFEGVPFKFYHCIKMRHSQKITKYQSLKLQWESHVSLCKWGIHGSCKKPVLQIDRSRCQNGIESELSIIAKHMIQGWYHRVLAVGHIHAHKVNHSWNGVQGVASRVIFGTSAWLWMVCLPCRYLWIACVHYWNSWGRGSGRSLKI